MRIRVARVLLAAFATAVAFAPPASPAHADEGWVIDSFDSQIAIGTDGVLVIQEDVKVDFGSLQKHGIFRAIPLRYRYDDTHDRYYNLNVAAVTDGTRAIPYSTSVESDNEVIKMATPMSS